MVTSNGPTPPAASPRRASASWKRSTAMFTGGTRVRCGATRRGSCRHKRDASRPPPGPTAAAPGRPHRADAGASCERMTEELSAEAFYDDLADDYHLILPTDLDVGPGRGRDPRGLLAPATRSRPRRILGIGTQALALAACGEVVGRDLSAKAIERARREADARGSRDRPGDGRHALGRRRGRWPSPPRSPATTRSLTCTPTTTSGACSPPCATSSSGRDVPRHHLGLRRARRRARGRCPRALHDDEAGRRIVTQAWEWSADLATVRIHHVVAREDGGRWDTTVRVTLMRAWKRTEITALLKPPGSLASPGGPLRKRAGTSPWYPARLVLDARGPQSGGGPFEGLRASSSSSWPTCCSARSLACRARSTSMSAASSASSERSLPGRRTPRRTRRAPGDHLVVAARRALGRAPESRPRKGVCPGRKAMSPPPTVRATTIPPRLRKGPSPGTSGSTWSGIIWRSPATQASREYEVR